MPVDMLCLVCQRLSHRSQPLDTGPFRDGEIVMDTDHELVEVHSLRFIFINFWPAADLNEKFGVFEFYFIELRFILREVVCDRAFISSIISWACFRIFWSIFAIYFPVDYYINSLE